jgi:hypothetical protein
VLSRHNAELFALWQPGGVEKRTISKLTISSRSFGVQRRCMHAKAKFRISTSRQALPSANIHIDDGSSSSSATIHLTNWLRLYLFGQVPK